VATVSRVGDLARRCAPRLAYRLRTGGWCDHVTRIRITDGDGGLVDPWQDRGWEPWQMWDLGRDKIRICHRCGHVETLAGHPIRDRLTAGWYRIPDRWRLLMQGAGILVGIVAWDALIVLTPAPVSAGVGLATCLVVGLLVLVATRRQR
jgi:hypothetical protein